MSAIKVGVISVIIGAIGIVAILVTPPGSPRPRPPRRPARIELYLALMIMSSFIMSVVCTFMVYSVWRLRARPGDEDRDGPPIHGNTASRSSGR